MSARNPLVFVFTGESNSGGIGLNSDAAARELAPRRGVRIMNLINGRFNFEALHLGVNNLCDHAGLEQHVGMCHGFENELANAVEAGVFPGHRRVYLIKTGQGGSTIAQWTPEHPSGYWRKFVQRIAAGKRQLPATVQWVVWLSLGINDALAGTPVDAWKEDLRAHLKRINAQLPGAVIVMTQFQSMNLPMIDADLAEIAATDGSIFVVDTSEAELRNLHHWSYAGLKTVAARLAEVSAAWILQGIQSG